MPTTTPRDRLLTRRGFLIGGGALAVGAIGTAAAALDIRIQVTRYHVTSRALTGPVTLAVLADLHSEPYPDGGAALLRQVGVLEPDLILLPGDIVDDELSEEPAHRVVKGLTAIAPTFWISGNHDCWTGELPRIKRDMARLGAVVLAGDTHRVALPGGTVTVMGVDDPDAGEGLYSDQIDALARTTVEGFAVLLAHRPERTFDYSELPVDLVVSGHAHGGQWRLPFLLDQGLYAPNQGLFPQRTSGVFSLQTARPDAQHVVSRGLATSSTRVPRLGNRPEIVVVHAGPPQSTEDS